MTKTAPLDRKVRQQTNLLSSLVTGLVLSFADITVGISLASLIFSGSLAAFLPRGLAIVFLSGIIHALFSARFTSQDEIITVVQDNPIVLLAVAVSSIAAFISPSELLATVLALILVSTILTGAVLLLLGVLRLGGLVRYIPYPVIGGFLCGTGWLLVQGAIGTMANYGLNLENLPALLQPHQVTLWLPGVMLGILLFAAARRFHHVLVTPTILMAGLILFFVILGASGVSISEAEQRGLLLGSAFGQVGWQPPLEIASANWSAILGQAGSIGTVVLITVIGVLLNTSALETILHRDTDLNHELQITGLANLVSGLFGGMIGFTSLADSAQTQRLRARARTVSLVFAAAYLFMLFFGTSILAYVPKALTGGLLLSLGLDFLYTWVIVGRKTLSRMDYAVVLLILVIIALFGFLVGVAVGLVLMIILFVVNYSRLNIFHSIASGAEITSHVERNAYHQQALAELGKQVYVLELQGFLFFGTANLVFEQVRKRLETPGQSPLSFLVLDFHRVTGVDASATLSLTKINDLAIRSSFTLILTQVTGALQNTLTRNGLDTNVQIKLFPDLDHGLEWCENTLLEREQVTKMHFPIDLEHQLADHGFQKAATLRLKVYLQRIEFQSGEYLMRQGDPSDNLSFIESGQVSIYLESAADHPLRLQTLGAGTVIGEIGLYLNAPRSASVIADELTVAYQLERQALETMKVHEAELAFQVNDLVMHVIAERLMTADREILALHR